MKASQSQDEAFVLLLLLIIYFWHFSMKENSVCLLNLKIRFRFIREKFDILNQQ